MDRVLKQALKMLNVDPNFYLFDSRTHKQLPQCFSYIPDPEAIRVDAFTFELTNATYYDFPPFSINLQTIKNLQQIKRKGWLLCQTGQTKCGFPLIFEMIISVPILLISRKLLLTIPAARKKFVIHSGENLICWCVISQESSIMWRTFRKIYYNHHAVVTKWYHIYL